MLIQEAKFNSESYWSAVQLRREVLRFPLNLDFSGAELALEGCQTHWVIENEGEVVASATIVWPAEATLPVKVRQVAVATNQQGQGLGRKIMAACEGHAREKGYETVALHARETAVPFYLGLGYSLEGEPFEEVGIPHRKMTKSLSV